MAHFCGTLTGNHANVTRGGTPSSGMVTVCASRKGAIRCSAYIEEGVDYVCIEKILWLGRGEHKLLYDGPIGEIQEEQTEVFGGRDSRSK